MRRWATRLAIAVLALLTLAILAILLGPRILRHVDVGIPQLPSFSAPRPFIGAPARPRPIASPPVPQHPFMARNGRSLVHDDAYMSDTYRSGGPLGRAVKVRSRFLGGLCGTVTFDRRGRIVTLCLGVRERVLALLDPRKLDRLASMSLPGKSLGRVSLTDFSGGGYFYLDERDRAVVPTTRRHVYVIAEAAGPSFRRVRDVDLSRVVPEGDSINSALPDWRGRLWFVSTHGVVGVVSRDGAPRALRLPEGIENSFAVDESGGVFVVSDRALYRFDRGPGGRPRVTWREAYPNSGVRKPGQADAGSGTTPTVLGRRWVAIADNARGMGVLVYRRERGYRGARRVCRTAVFGPGRGATENSLIGAGRSLIVENNYGYGGPGATLGGASTQPGIARVDITSDGRGCRVVWTSRVRAPSVVPKLSLADGLIYTYTKPAGEGSAPWYLTALDFRTGRTVYSALAGRGVGYNNHYAPVTLGPDASAYVGVLGGLVRLGDSRPPA